MKLKKLLLSSMAILACSSYAGELKLDMSTKLGLSIQSPMGDVSACSRIIAVEPPWENLWYFNQTAQSNFSENTTEDGVQSVAMTQIDDEKLKINEYTATADGNKVKIYFNAELTEDLPTHIEYSALNVMDYLLLGGTYKATLSNGEVVTGKVDPENTAFVTMIRDFKKVEFNSHYGSLTVTVLKGIGLNVDIRRDQTFEGFNTFWIGRYGQPLAYGEVFESEIELEFIQNKNVTIPTPIKSSMEPLKATENSHLRRAAEQFELPVMPTIKDQMLLPQAPLTLAKNLKVELDFNANSAEVAKLDSAIKRLYAKLETSKYGNTTTIKAKVGDSLAGLKSPEEADGYAMLVTRHGINIVSKSARGVYYAMQTLRSLADSGKVHAQKIIDYPSMEFRGIHFFADSGSLDFHGELIEDLFGRYKINHIIYEIERLQWDSTKNVHWPKSMSKEDLQAFLKLCDENYIEVSPLLQTLGHFDWFFSFNKNLEFAEDPEMPYAYNVSHPDLYPMMEEIMDEVIEAFGNPKYMHIGHDEVDMRGRYPYQPENVERGIADLVMSDIMFYYDYLTERNIRVMMWHDMIMTPEESSNASGMGLSDVKKYRDMLPRDIVIADWNYSGTKSKGQFPCIQLLEDEGFDTLGCTWFVTNNIENMAMAVDKANAWGLLGTTWSGYFGSDVSLQQYFHQVATYLRLAAWAWNPTPEANAGRHNFLKEFSILTNEVWPQPNVGFGNNGKMLSLDSVVNIEISKAANSFNNDLDYNLNEILDAGKINYVGDMAFDIAEVNGNIGAIALNSQSNRLFPKSVTIPMGDLECRALYLLHTNIADSGVLGKATALGKVTYTDGTAVSFDIINGSMIGSLNDPVYSYTMGPADGTERYINGETTYLIYGTWNNPYPQKKIKELTISNGAIVRPYYLFGISAQ